MPVWSFHLLYLQSIHKKIHLFLLLLWTEPAFQLMCYVAGTVYICWCYVEHILCCIEDTDDFNIRITGILSVCFCFRKFDEHQLSSNSLCVVTSAIRYVNVVLGDFLDDLKIPLMKDSRWQVFYVNIATYDGSIPNSKRSYELPPSIKLIIDCIFEIPHKKKQTR